jgi:hypothetical protein
MTIVWPHSPLRRVVLPRVVFNQPTSPVPGLHLERQGSDVNDRIKRPVVNPRRFTQPVGVWERARAAQDLHPALWCGYVLCQNPQRE